MNVSGARRRANLSIADEPAESAAAQVVARARIIMLISALTTVLAIAAVTTVIGYRMFGGSGPVVATDEVIPLPKGALDLDLRLGGAPCRVDRTRRRQ
jgi:hypothetical protein